MTKNTASGELALKADAPASSLSFHLYYFTTLNFNDLKKKSFFLYFLQLQKTNIDAPI
jgi:hypothetical protein